MVAIHTIIRRRTPIRLLVSSVGACLLLAILGAAPPSRAATQVDTSDGSPRTSQALFVRGLTQAYLEDYDEAIAYFEKALEDAPNEPAVLSALAEAEAARDNLTSALYYARQARTHGSQNAYYHSTLAELLDRANRPREAAAAYERLLSKFPNETEARLELARLQAKLDQPQEALSNYKTVVDSTRQRRGDVYAEMLELYRQVGNEEGRERTLKALIGLRHGSARYRRQLGELYVDQERYREAIPHFERLLKESPRNPHLLTRLKMLYAKTSQPEKAKQLWADVPRDQASPDQLVGRARALYRQARSDSTRLAGSSALESAIDLLYTAVETDSTHVEALDLLGTLEYRRENYKKSARLLTRALDENPKDVERWHRAASATLKSGRAAEAATIAQEGSLLFPGRQVLLRVDAVAHLKMGDYEKAQALFENTLHRVDSASTSKRTRAQLYAGLGRAEENLGNISASDRAFEKALSLAPDDPEVLVPYTFSLTRRDRDLEHARHLAERAVEQNPQNPRALDALGRVYYKQGAYEAAKSYVRKALQTGTASALVYEHFGDVLEALGNHSKAQQYWRKALERAPGRETLQQKIKKSSSG